MSVSVIMWFCMHLINVSEVWKLICVLIIIVLLFSLLACLIDYTLLFDCFCMNYNSSVVAGAGEVAGMNIISKWIHTPTGKPHTSCTEYSFIITGRPSYQRQSS